MTASVWIISFVFLVFAGSALTGPLVRESCVNESKNRVSRDFRALIKHGRDYHKDLVQKQERTAVLQTADVQQADSKSECQMEFEKNKQKKNKVKSSGPTAVQVIP